MDLKKLITSTNAYKIFIQDKKSSTLSHATLVVCEDGDMLEKYLNVFAKAFMCRDDEFCNTCRSCSLIDTKSYEDVVFYPKGNKIVVSDVDDLVAKSFLKPLEDDKKLFVLVNAQDMNTQAQNKLLKVLEEPPKDTYILLGATSTYSLLPTVLSRVKRLDIRPFSDNEIYENLKEDFDNLEKLSVAVRLSGGKVGEAINKYSDDETYKIESSVIKILLELKSSKDVSKFSSYFTKENIKDYVSVFSSVMTDCLRFNLSGSSLSTSKEDVKKVCDTYSNGALIYALDRLREIEKALFFNGNIQVLADKMLFSFLEGKHKWLK